MSFVVIVSVIYHLALLPCLYFDEFMKDLHSRKFSISPSLFYCGQKISQLFELFFDLPWLPYFAFSDIRKRVDS